MKKLLPLLLLIIPSVSLSQSLFYCEVMQVVERSAYGEIVSNQDYQNDQVGSTFTVNKATGEIAGSYFINNTTAFDIEIVVNTGTDFIVVSKSAGGYVGYFSIHFNSFSDKYLFTYTRSGQWIHTGTCS